MTYTDVFIKIGINFRCNDRIKMYVNRLLYTHLDGIDATYTGVQHREYKIIFNDNFKFNIDSNVFIPPSNDVPDSHSDSI